MTVRPLHDRIIVQRIDEGEQNVGGIIIPGKEQGRGDAGRRHARRHVLRSSVIRQVEHLFNAHAGKPRPRRAGNLTGDRPIGS